MAQDYVPGEVIVKMKDSGDVDTSNVARKMSAHGVSLQRGWSRFNTYQFKVNASQSVEDAVEEISNDPNVEYAEPNYLVRRQSMGIQGKPMSYSELQEEFASASSGSSQKAAVPSQIRAEETWPLLDPEAGPPIVAVIDSGCDYNHYVFANSGAIWENTDEIPDNDYDDDGNGYKDDTLGGWDFANNDKDPMDDDNHGTHVAGSVLAVTQDIFKEPIDPAIVQIMCLKFLDNNGVGNTADAIEAIEYAISNGAHVINNSWGGPGFSRALLEVVVKSYNSKRVFVAAAGNLSQDNDRIANYPSNYKVPNVISVAATTHDDRLASFSNYGVTSVHLGSPGDRILSTLPNDSFGYNSGTSMAAPFVSGLAALMIREQMMNGYQIREALLSNSLEIVGLPVSSESRIDVFDAIDFVQNNEVSQDQPQYVYNPSDYNYRGVAADDFESFEEAGACGLVTKVLRDSNKKGGRGSSGKGIGFSLFLLFAPLFLINFLRIRRRKQLYSRREHSRYKMESEVRIDVNGQKLIGNMSSISVGGASIDTDALLEKGGIVTLNIASPDGKQQVEVQGRVVWSQEKKAYGLQFFNAENVAQTTIKSWTKSLSKI